VDSLLSKLVTTKVPECAESEVCALPTKYSLITGAFDTELRCASRRVGCPASKIGRREPLVLGRDVEECDSWGIDMVTRKALDSAIAVRDISAANAIVEGLLLKHIMARSSPVSFAIIFVVFVCLLTPVIMFTNKEMGVAVEDAMAAVQFALGLRSDMPVVIFFNLAVSHSASCSKHLTRCLVKKHYQSQDGTTLFLSDALAWSFRLQRGERFVIH